ncbi:hypothetical protein EU527_01320 [Candidatus Thorarchaeota archaeon]|nr:MAG: hypothetical protein EU527_01320 [Candidatus Thorarchaeota archaeon]
MGVDILSNELIEAMKIFETPKFMITKDSNDNPNIALVMTWNVYRGNTLVYGDFLTSKSRENLDQGNNQISILVMTMNLDSWLVKANFESFHRNDEIYEFIAQTPLFRYNQYTNARGAGVAEAVSSSDKYSISKLSVLSSFIKAKVAKGKVPIAETIEGNLPKNIFKTLSQMAAIKALAFVDTDGYPIAFPEFGMVPVSNNTIVMKRTQEKQRGYDLREGQRVAISLVSLEPAAFQMKGSFHIINDSIGYIRLDRVYACSLPRPGVRVDIPMLIPEGS